MLKFSRPDSAKSSTERAILHNSRHNQQDQDQEPALSHVGLTSAHATGYVNAPQNAHTTFTLGPKMKRIPPPP